MTAEIPQNVATIEPVTVEPKETQNNTEAKAALTPPSPAQDLRDIQGLLVMGIFPGNLAPQVVKAYSLLENMAKHVETEAANVAK